MILLGIDLGTTGCKSMAFTEKGDILGDHYIEYDLNVTKEGFIDQDANVWWDDVKTSILSTIEKAGINGRDIGALSISSQGISVVPVDADGGTLMPAISWLDGRAVDEAHAMQAAYDAQDFFRLTGKQMHPSYVFPKIMWIKKHRPQVYEKTYKFLMGMDFLLHRFSGRFVTDYSMASGTLCYDINDMCWYEEAFDRFDIDIGKMPELIALGDVVGRILPAVADELGLSHEALIVCGAQDQRCAAIGAGIADGVMTVSLGTATAACTICPEPRIDPEMRVTCCGLDRDGYMLESVVGTSGAALKWVRNTFFPEVSYRELDVLAEAADPGAGGVMFFPNLSDRGFGGEGAFCGMGLQNGREDIIRAVLEGIAMQICRFVHDHRRINGEVRELRLFGGGAKSAIWCSIIADMTGCDVVLTKTHETGNLGAAIIAGVGAGVYESYEQAARSMGVAADRVKPNAENHKIYRGVYDRYIKAGAAVSPRAG